jgi:myb proto-oncogene protein
LFPGQQEQQ